MPYKIAAVSVIIIVYSFWPCYCQLLLHVYMYRFFFSLQKNDFQIMIDAVSCWLFIMAHIKTYCRIKPTKSSFGDYQISTDTLHIQVPENLRDTATDVNIRHRPVINHDFKFTYVFTEDTSQEDVFNRLAKDIVDGTVKTAVHLDLDYWHWLTIWHDVSVSQKPLCDVSLIWI